MTTSIIRKNFKYWFQVENIKQYRRKKSVSLDLGNAAFLHIFEIKRDIFSFGGRVVRLLKIKTRHVLCTILGQKEEIVRFANDLVVRVNCSNYLSTRQWKVTYCHEWSLQRIVQLRTSQFFSSCFFNFSLDDGDPIMKFPWTISH